MFFLFAKRYSIQDLASFIPTDIPADLVCRSIMKYIIPKDFAFFVEDDNLTVE